MSEGLNPPSPISIDLFELPVAADYNGNRLDLAALASTWYQIFMKPNVDMSYSQLWIVGDSDLAGTWPHLCKIDIELRLPLQKWICCHCNQRQLVFRKRSITVTPFLPHNSYCNPLSIQTTYCNPFLPTHNCNPSLPSHNCCNPSLPSQLSQTLLHLNFCLFLSQ